MPKHSRPQGTDAVVIEPKALDGLIGALERRGYRVIGPVLSDGAIDWQPVNSLDQLPRGWTSTQAAGKYRVERRSDEFLFAYATGPATLKRFLHAPEVRLFSVESNGSPFEIIEHRDESPPCAFIGARACDLAALAVLDRVLIADRYPDSMYQRRRENAFLVAVNCTEPAGTCFCTSFGAGPEAKSGYDLLLTELRIADRHCFLMKIGSARGQEVAKEIEHSPTTGEVLRAASEAMAEAARRITRTIDPEPLPRVLFEQFEHPEWERVAGRCLSCGNCTQACPTCFCITMEDTSDIDGQRAERWRKWDSCFTLGHSYIHGGSVRQSGKARYRQWATHKFAAWQEQFGTSGCIGCGRCITWCPAEIDIIEVLEAVQRGSGTQANNKREEVAK
jgi:sulfhydrogenase subunit beta (sulfur reductase)